MKVDRTSRLKLGKGRSKPFTGRAAAEISGGGAVDIPVHGHGRSGEMVLVSAEKLVIEWDTGIDSSLEDFSIICQREWLRDHASVRLN